MRHDGGHRRDDFALTLLGPHVEWVRFCPEADAGLGTPREPMRLVSQGKQVRLIAVTSGTDHTGTLAAYSAKQMKGLGKLQLSGFLLKKNSPSCGMERVKLYGPKGIPVGQTSGVFAAALLQAFPHLPVEEEGRLQNPVLRDNFVERVFAYRRLEDFFAGTWNLGGLVAFHTAHKYQLLAHSPTHYESLGRLVATAKGQAKSVTAASYREGFMTALEKTATPARHTNVLHHLAGYLKEKVATEVRAEIATVIDDYRAGLVPLVVPLTLLKHYVRLHRIEYLLNQHYLEPHPKELMLRNHV